jgi:hypothetical protein
LFPAKVHQLQIHWHWHGKVKLDTSSSGRVGTLLVNSHVSNVSSNLDVSSTDRCWVESNLSVSVH